MFPKWPPKPSTDAPWDSNRSIISTFPEEEAAWSGSPSSLSMVLGFAPFSRRYFAIPRWLAKTASRKGYPKRPRTPSFAPALTTDCTKASFRLAIAAARALPKYPPSSLMPMQSCNKRAAFLVLPRKRATWRGSGRIFGANRPALPLKSRSTIGMFPWKLAVSKASANCFCVTSWSPQSIKVSATWPWSLARAA